MLNGIYEFIPNVTCLDTSPEHYQINKEPIRYIYSELAGVKTPNELKNIIFKNISNFIDSTTMINCTNFIAQILVASEVDPVE